MYSSTAYIGTRWRWVYALADLITGEEP